MIKIYRGIGIIVILAFLASALVFSFGLILLAVTALGVFGLYHRFLARKRMKAKPPNFRSNRETMSHSYSGEVIDMPVELIDQKGKPGR